MNICRMCCGRWASSTVRASRNADCLFKMGTAPALGGRQKFECELHISCTKDMRVPLQTPMHIHACTCQ